MPECTKCKEDVAAESRFCANCGAAVAPAELTVTSPPRAVEPEVIRSAPVQSANVHGRFEPGTRLGNRYRIVGLLGRGGMGEVYRADDLELGQSVALKFLPERVANDSVALDRFRSEVRTARQVTHANVCRIYDIAGQDGHVFLSMEYVDGEDLARVLRRLGRPSREKAVEIARQICLGLATAHENNVLHRDLKPANIMIDGRGRVRITDFGLAGLADELEQSESRAGTPAYMAPEQLAHGRVSARSDIYSLGLILYELFTGKGVFDTNDIEELKRNHTSGTVSPPSSISEEVDPAVEQVIMRCLNQQTEQRPQSVYQVLAALPGGDPLAAALAAGETPSPELVANARDAGGLRPAIAVGLLVGMVAAIAITYFVYVGKTVIPDRPPDVLSVVAEQTMKELGYPDSVLERVNSISGYDVNTELSASLRSSPRSVDELAELHWPPRFRYWRRWTPGAFISADVHNPEYFTLDGRTTTELTASVSLDSTGRLRGLVATPPPNIKSAGAEVDWSPLFRRAQLNESHAVAIPPVKRPPVYCDQVVAWRIEGLFDSGDPVTVQMGAVQGRANYFEILGLNEAMAEKNIEGGSLTTMVRPSAIRQVLRILMVILAWHNLRASRGDRRSAFRCATIVGTFYALTHVLARFLQDQTVGDQTWRDGGHVILHALEVWIFYLAMEPYVRRIWPRMLIGVVRLLSGRLRDPAVGREVLIGVVAGCGLVAVLALTSSAEMLLKGEADGNLPSSWELRSRLSPIQFLCLICHRAAWTIMDTVVIAGLLVALRLLARITLATIGLGVALLGLAAYLWYTEVVDASQLPALTYAVCFGVTMVLLYTRVGVLAGMVAFFVLVPDRITITAFESWFTPYVVAGLAIVLLLAAYGLWVSLAGQPIFKYVLAEPEAERQVTT